MTDEILKISADDFSSFARENLTKGVTIRFRAHGRSMYPAIHNGDIITISPINTHGIKRGDIILYRTDAINGLIAHRVIKIKPHKSDKIIYTRGDASGGELEQVKEKNILGKATHIEHDGKTLRIDTLKARTKGQLWFLRQSLRHLYNKLNKKLKS